MADAASPSLLKELPQELLFVILKQVRNMSSSSSFLSCLLTCRRWCDLGRRLLYNFISLRNSNLEAFLIRFSPANCFLVKSLTIRIDPVSPKLNSAGKYEETTERLNRNGSSESRALWGRLERLAAMISKMNTLSAFSFFMASNLSTFPGFWIPSSIIASMIENLSNKCVSLEIDTSGREFSRLRSVHLCDKIRDVLPRLRHLRVRLYRLCPAMFCTEVNEDGTINRQSVARSASSLKTVIISCDMLYRGDQWLSTARVCGAFGQPISCADRFIRSESRRSLVAALRDFFLRGNYPKIERLWLIDSHRSNYSPAKYDAYYRRDIVLDKTWVIPRIRIASSWSTRDFQREAIFKEHLLLRAPEGHDVICSRTEAENLAEAQTWQETFSECRMPAATDTDDFQRDQHGWAKPLSAESIETFKLRSPAVHCQLWVNEEKTGQRLLHAFEYPGLIDRPAANEITPNGWIRIGEELELELESWDCVHER